MADYQNSTTSEDASKNFNQKKMDFPFVIFGVNTPHIAERIFGHLDNKTLLKCREVSTGWMYYVDSNSTLWDNMADMFGRTPLHYAACEGQYDICHLIVRYIPSTNHLF